MGTVYFVLNLDLKALTAEASFLSRLAIACRFLKRGTAMSVMEFLKFSLILLRQSHEKITEILRCKEIKRFVNHRGCFFVDQILHGWPTKSLVDHSFEGHALLIMRTKYL